MRRIVRFHLQTHARIVLQNGAIYRGIVLHKLQYGQVVLIAQGGAAIGAISGSVFFAIERRVSTAGGRWTSSRSSRLIKLVRCNLKNLHWCSSPFPSLNSGH